MVFFTAIPFIFRIAVLFAIAVVIGITGIAVKAYWSIEIPDRDPIISIVATVFIVVVPFFFMAISTATMTATVMIKTHSSFLRILGKICPVLIIYAVMGCLCVWGFTAKIDIFVWILLKIACFSTFWF